MRILITGGTGTIGKALLKRFDSSHSIRVFSRDELKQAQLQTLYPNVEFMIGDVKDYQRIKQAMAGIDIVIHAAAMKRIEICEQWPIEAVKTNVLGTENVVNAAVECGVKKLISLGSDKGVEPINVYGMTKAIQEKITIGAGFNCARYGNVLGSRGSVVPLFKEQLAKNEPLTVTDPDMTRFILTIDDALDTIEKAMNSEMTGSIFIKKSFATRTGDIAKAISDNIKVVGSFGCEKKHEILISKEEMPKVKDAGDYYVVLKNNLNNKTVPIAIDCDVYASNTVKLLTVDEIKKHLDNIS